MKHLYCLSCALVLWIASGFTTNAFAADTTKPSLSNIRSSSITVSSAVITWTTNEPANSQVTYGKSTSYGSTSPLDTNLVLQHQVALSNLSPGTSYNYRVRSTDAAGNLSTSSNYTFKTVSLPAAPSNLSAASISGTQINLAWRDNSSNESGFRIERSTDGTNFLEIFVTGSNVRSYSNTNLQSSTKYYYRIRAYTANGYSLYSSTVNATTKGVSPVAPSNLAADASSTSAVNLSWTDNSNNEVGFKIERSSDGSNFSQIALAQAEAGNYSDPNLQSSKKYYYRVRAYNSIGDSGYSNIANATTLLAPPLAPANLAASGKSTTQIDLSWSDTSLDEDGFKIERSSDGTNFAQIATAPSNAKTYPDSGLESSTTYYYRILAYNSAGESAYSGVANATTLSPPPASPADLAATAVSSGRIDLSWADNSADEDGFKLERSIDGVSFNQIATPNANSASYSDSDLQSSTRYYYRIRSYNGIGNSDFSNLADAKTFLGEPGSLTATARSSTKIDLSWTDHSSDEDGFKIERSLDGTTFTEIATASSNRTSYTDFGLEASTTYHYRIRGYASAEYSGYSPVANATTAAPPPIAPANLTATAVSSNRIDLLWTDNSANEDGFKLERSIDGTNFTQIATPVPNAASYSDSNLRSSTQYYYRIRSYNVDGDSDYDNGANAKTFLGEPGSLTATAKSSNQIDLSWSDNSWNEEGFKIERSIDNIAYQEIAVTTANTNAYSDVTVQDSTTYYYKIRSYDGAENSSYTSVVSATTPGPAPAAAASLTATAVSDNAINLSWIDTSGDEDGFEIERSIDGTNFAHIAVTQPNAASHSDTGLDSSTLYYYRIRAFNAGGHSPYSGTASATTLQGPPRAPDDLAAISVSPAQIDLSWSDNSSNEDGFKIERSTDGTSFQQIDTVFANIATYSDATVHWSNTYYYRVRAYNSAGDSPYSEVVSATAEPPVSTPENLAAVASSSSQVDLTWTDTSKGEVGFKIERSRDGKYFEEVGTVQANTVTYSDSDLQPVTTYYYRVRAYTEIESSAFSNVANATTLNASPPPPGNLTATAISGTQITLTWADNSPNEDGFKIERSVDNITFSQITVAARNSRSYTNSGLQNTRTYYYRIRAYNAIGNSAYTAVATATTYGPAPLASSNLSATTISSNRIDLLWNDASNDEDGFDIERSENGTTFFAIATIGPNQTSYSDSTVWDASAYYYRVRAFNKGGNSAFTNVATASTPSGPPLRPTDLRARVLQGMQIELSWNDNSTVEDGFKLEMSLDGTVYDEVATLPPNTISYLANNLLPLTNYYYRVRAFNALGDSGYGEMQTGIRADVPTVPVFPGAVGFGTETPAGRGGAILKVTNLNDSGPGSLREAVNASGPRIVVFEVSGTIELESELKIWEPYVTVAGQTAPSPGITLKDAELCINTHDVLVQHIRVRVGDQPPASITDIGGIDGIAADGPGAYNIVFDHVSVSWAIDENATSWYEGVHDTTFSNCIISEALYQSIHPKGARSMGLLITPNGRNVSIIGNLMAHNNDRNPLISNSAAAVIANNVFYNWKGGRATNIGNQSSSGIPEPWPTLVSVVANSYIAGIDTATTSTTNAISTSTALNARSQVYYSDNRLEGLTNTFRNQASYSPVVATAPIWLSGFTALAPDQLENQVLSNAGARPYDRDEVDARIVNDVNTRTGRIINSQYDVGGWPSLETNYRAIDIPADAYADDDGDGYTNFEETVLFPLAAQLEGKQQ